MLAAAAEAAALQGAFWEFHDSLYADQGRLDDPHLWDRVRRLGLDLDRFEADRRAEPVAERVQRDFRSAIRAGVTSTPTLFVDGAAHAGVPGADLLARLRHHAGMSEARAVLDRWFESFAAADYATTLDCMVDDVEYHELPDWPGAREGTVYRGKEDVVAWYTELLAEWDGLESEPGAMTEVGGGQIVVEETWRARGRQSGVQVEMRAASVFTIREGRITRVRYFRSADEALAAARAGA